ncbi:unnamed protein product [Polarella glacialis]|uniref:Uncharacterized protein n=1 Tax=Polarella glacialis TaxID=89957 RepID=A0A813H3F6_POLGL|nr:unnamed protein product [Polarella glacialis]
MASSGRNGTSVDITLVDISGKEITDSTWDGHCKAHELFQAAYGSKPGFLRKLLHGSQELSPQSDLASLCHNFCQLTVVWMRGADHKTHFVIHPAFAAVKSDGSVITWGQGGGSSRVELGLQRRCGARSCQLRRRCSCQVRRGVITWGGIFVRWQQFSC